MIRKLFIVILVVAVAGASYYLLTRERIYSTHSRKALEYYQAGVDNMMKYYWEDALSDMKVAVKEDPDFPLPYLFLLRVGTNDMDKDQMSAWYKKLATPDPKWTDFEKGLVSLAMESPKADKLENKAAEIDAFLRKYPTRMEAFYLLIPAYRQLVDDPDKLVNYYETLHQRYPNNVQILNMMGYLYVDLGEISKAKMAFEKYVYIRPGEANPYDSFGEFYYNTGDFHKAESYFRKALSRKPDFVLSKLHLARALMHQGRIKDSLKILDDLQTDPTTLKMVPDAAQLFRFFCFAYTNNKEEMSKMVKNLDQMNLVDSIQSQIRLLYSFFTHDAAGQKTIIDKLESKPKMHSSTDLIVYKANLLFSTGHPQESIDLLKSKISDRILNGNFDIRYFVYYIFMEDYMALGLPDKAVAKIQQLPEGYREFFLMRIAAKKGDLEEAARHAEKVLSVYKSADPDFYVVTEARKYAKQGDSH